MTAGAPPGIAVEIDVERGDWPSADALEADIRRVIQAASEELPVLRSGGTELSVVFTDDAGIRALNAEWRRKDKATNVLSFPAFPNWPSEGLPPMLGDIVLACETVKAEAALDRKAFEHHLMHLVAHGLLHLLGHDHEEEGEAEAMEALERRILARLAIPDPYG